jgi:flagellar protein FlaE
MASVEAADPAAETADAAAAADGDAADTDDEGGKPYLRSMPEGYAADLLVMEWLEYLIAESDVREASEAIAYYERIDWIDEAVADDLRSYLAGFETAGSGGTLTIDHHTQSLRYISQLNGDTADQVAMQMMSGGGGDGLQR